MSEKPGHDAVFARCFVAGVLSTVVAFLFNGRLFAAFDGIFAWTRDESTWLDVALLILLLMVARYRPWRIDRKVISVASCCMGLTGCVMCSVGLGCSSPAVLISGVALNTPISAWSVVVWLLACADLDLRRMCLCLAGSCATGVPIAYALNQFLPFDALNVLTCAASIGIVALSAPLTGGFFHRLSTVGVPAEQEALHPFAFLPFGHTLYVYIFGFGLAFGFALRSDDVMSSPAASLLMLATMVGITAYAWHAKDKPKVDTVFVVSFMLVTVGFVLLAAGPIAVGAASALLVAGYMSFELLMWYALCAVASRNTVDAIPAICWGTTVCYLGICAGVGLWFAANLAVAPALGHGETATAVTVAAVAGLMLLYVLLTWRGFSFDDTIAGVAPDAPQVSVRYVDRLEERCAQVALDCGLTARERQVMGLLARGNNSQHVQDELCIGRNTVKYHVKNVYVKLGVHSQQELIDLVAGTSRPQADDAGP